MSLTDWFVGQVRCVNGVLVEKLSYGFRLIESGKIVASIKELGLE